MKDKFYFAVKLLVFFLTVLCSLAAMAAIIAAILYFGIHAIEHLSQL